MSWNSKTWSWVKKYFSVNPLSTDGMPVVGKFRTPAVGSRPEKYKYPKSPASNVSGNYYFQRDTRRNYPRLAVYTQQDVAGLIEGASVKSSLPLPHADNQPVTPAKVTEVKPLVEVLNTKQLYSVQNPAPTPNWGRKVEWKLSEDFVPPNNGSYFPMRVFTA
ncbi:uncharacterized protein BYT42DRAFT_578206 [Radiomyces spectabilis]|uniref:uncharacterized protein n=1 Tax=Radiomyces spectabilis TaxID=64574 RepID=UPI00222099A7|nr:uncharacterized protein BYT42DRAFT_578206 [Radiomyces spectabilis]KAI8372840.1 hypothetical protein BYT42DRAFT_578206 [Radiomyces spectabilis]